MDHDEADGMDMEYYEAREEIEAHKAKELAYLREIEELQALRDKQFLEIERLRSALAYSLASRCEEHVLKGK